MPARGTDNISRGLLERLRAAKDKDLIENMVERYLQSLPGPRETTEADFLRAVNASVSDDCTMVMLLEAADYCEREAATDDTIQEAPGRLKARDLIDLLYCLIATKSEAAEKEHLK